MAKVRYIGPEPVTVPELFGHDRYVQPDEVLTVPDERFAGYVCQPHTWETVEEPADWNAPDPVVEAPGNGAVAPLAALGQDESVLKKSAVKKTAAAKTEPRKED